MEEEPGLSTLLGCRGVHSVLERGSFVAGPRPVRIPDALLASNHDTTSVFGCTVCQKEVTLSRPTDEPPRLRKTQELSFHLGQGSSSMCSLFDKPLCASTGHLEYPGLPYVFNLLSLRHDNRFLPLSNTDVDQGHLPEGDLGLCHSELCPHILREPVQIQTDSGRLQEKPSLVHLSDCSDNVPANFGFPCICHRWDTLFSSESANCSTIHYHSHSNWLLADCCLDQ